MITDDMTHSIFHRSDFANYIDFSDDSCPKKLNYTPFDSYIYNKIKFSQKSINLFHGSDDSGKILSSTDLLVGLLDMNFSRVSSSRAARVLRSMLDESSNNPNEKLMMMLRKRMTLTLLRPNIPLT